MHRCVGQETMFLVSYKDEPKHSKKLLDAPYLYYIGNTAADLERLIKMNVKFFPQYLQLLG